MGYLPKGKIMKKIIVLSAMALITTSTMAASPAVIKAILSSKEVRSITNIEKVEVVATYRCPNCYDVEVTGSNLLGNAWVKVHTEQNIGGPLTITTLESSR